MLLTLLVLLRVLRLCCVTVVIPVVDVDVVDPVERDVHFGRPREVHEGEGLVLRLDRPCSVVATAACTAEFVMEESSVALPLSANEEEGKEAGCGC